MKHKIKEILHEKLAKLLDHLYFQEIKSSANLVIILIFFIQKVNLVLWPDKNQIYKEQETFYHSCEQILLWITFQKPTEMFDSNTINTIITVAYTVLQLGMFIVFCFSLYKWQFISRFFSFYISNFQLLILYHTQIHLLSQNYYFPLSILLVMPLYINYLIITYCTRNFFIVTSQNMLRRYSYYNYVIIAIDFINFIFFGLLNYNIRLYSLLLLYIVYFLDSIMFRPYCSKMNSPYILFTSVLVILGIIKISMINFLICDQIYAFLIFAPLCSSLVISISSKKEDFLTQPLSLEMIIYLGEVINDFSKKSLQRKVGDNLVQKFSQYKTLNAESLLYLIQLYEMNQWNGKNKLLQNSFSQEREEIQLYITFLSQHIKGSYLQCLLQTKKYQIENKNHSLFFQVISSLISQKYDKQVENFSKNEAIQIQKNHLKLIYVREFQQFYLNHISEVVKILDKKISTWNNILIGFNSIDELLVEIIALHVQIKKLKQEHKSLKSFQQVIIDEHQLKDINILTLRYYSFFYSFIENDFLSSFLLEKQIEIILSQENDKANSQTINNAILKGELVIISASILIEKGCIKKDDPKELIQFFGLDENNIQLKNINQIMPKFISDKHNIYLDQFIHKGVSELFNNSKVVFSQDQDGFIFPVEINFLHINEKSNDFILTTVIKKVIPTYDYIIFDTSGQLVGISRKIYSLLTGHKSYGSSQSHFIEIDQKIFDCYIQFWIPQIIHVLTDDRGKMHQKNDKLIIEIFLYGELSIYLEKLIAEISAKVEYKTAECISMNVEQFFTNLNYGSSPLKIPLEADIHEIQLPNCQKYYSLEFQNVNSDIFSTPSLDNFIKLQSSNNQEPQNNLGLQQIDEFHQMEKGIDFKQQKAHEREIYYQQILNNQDSNYINFTYFNQDPLIKGDASYQTKHNLVNGQAQTHQSKESSNSNIQVYEIIQSIQQNSEINQYVKKIFCYSLLLKGFLLIFSSTMIKLFYDQNQFLQTNLVLARYPDKFNRLYCSITTMGQIDLERSLLGQDLGDYINVRIQELSQDLSSQMEDMMRSLRIQFSLLEQQNKLPNLNIRILNYFSYNEELMKMIQFNFLAEAFTQSMNKIINQHLEYGNQTNDQVINEYYSLQFLKGNLINQISSSQTLIDEIIYEIEISKENFLFNIKIFLLVQTLLIVIVTFLYIYFWRQPYQSIKLMLQLITFASDQYIAQSIEKAKLGKQIIQKSNWKQTNFFTSNFISGKKKESIDLQSIQIQGKSKISLRISNSDFQFRIIYVEILILTLLLFGVVFANYFYITSTLNSSHPEMELTLEYVQFKQDWDSLMILSYLLKTNSVLTQKVLELGFLDKNPELKDQNLYFHAVYREILKSFSTTVPLAQSLNEQIFADIIDSNRILSSDKKKLYDLYENDLCQVLSEALPFCGFENGKFKYFSDLPTPQISDNNREIFYNGINGVFQKILYVFQSQYEYELRNEKNTNQIENILFIQTQDFKFYILEYFFDINKAVVEFYSTILGAIVNILQMDYQNVLLFYLITDSCIFALEILLLCFFLSKLESINQASKSSLTLLPQESLSETKFFMILKRLKRDNS